MQAGRRAEISANQPHALTVVAPRSSSLPMGSSTSKPLEPTVAQKVRRAFAPRRRKEKDTHDSQSIHLAALSSQPLPIQIKPSSASSPPNFHSTSAHLSDDPRPLPPPPPPPKPSPESIPPPSIPSPPPPPNRSSIIPVTQAMESALTYIAITDRLQAQQLPVTPPSFPSQLPNPHSPPVPVQQHPSDTVPFSEQSLIQRPPTPEPEETKRIERPRARSESEAVLSERDYADKRKSDSTISHCTIRPGAGGPRSSRPVSMAESFQSTYTIVPGNGGPNPGVVMTNKRVSLVDPDLGSLEEDDDSFKSLDDIEDQRSSIVIVPGQEKPVSSPSLKPNRRSQSLTLGVALANAPGPLSGSPAELRHPSYSISEGFYNPPSSTSSSLAHSNQTQPWQMQHLQPSRNQNLPPIPHHPNPNATFTYPTQRPLVNHSAAPTSFRQTAVSFTSSLAPAAGFARKAVERVKGALGHMGHHNPSNSGSISSVSISSASGCSSSASVSSTAPSSFPNEWGVLNLTRTPSNQSSATHATHSSSMHAVNIKEVRERSERERQQQAAAEKKRMKKMRRTPNNQNGGTYSIGSLSTTSGSDSDAFTPTGPVLGMLLRGPLRNRNGVPAASGVVFGRDLSKCVRDTVVWARKEDAGADEGREITGRPELKVFEQRMLPAVVARCAQHLLIWGVQEEGLFRVPGRAAHIAKLRSEFDTGVDYDMSASSPSELDPHAVASIFKAYLRELPEHILTQKLSTYFDVAIEQESNTTATSPDPQPTSPWGTRKGIGLPSSQKPSPKNALGPIPSPGNSASPTSAFPVPNLRKPPSLSTFTLPSFTGMRPASRNLISALRSLIGELPRENRDLLRTVVELVRATAKESRLTKMPLSNLLMVFLPSLNVSAQLLRILCEEERIWIGLVDGAADGEKEQQGEINIAEEEVLDVRRNTVILDIKKPSEDQQNVDGENSTTTEGEQGQEDDDEEDEDDSHRRWTVVNRPEIPTLYLDSRSQASSTSINSSVLAPSSREASTTESSALNDDVSSISVSTRDDTEGVMSSSAESVMTPLTSSTHSSAAYLPLNALETVKDLSGRKGDTAKATPVEQRIQVVEPAPMGFEIGMENEEGQVRRLAISNPLPVSPSVASTTSSSEKNLPQTPLSPKRRSIPGLSFPSLSAFGQRNSHSSSGSEPGSPADSLMSDKSNSLRAHTPGLRTKKPSLKLLFSKKSAGSISSGHRDIIVVNGPSSAPGSAPGSAGSHLSVSQQLKTASMVLASGGDMKGCGDCSCSSDSSVSTPVSAVTCPGTTLNSAGDIGTRAAASVLELPPVLHASFEEGPSLRHELGLDESPPGTAKLAKEQQEVVGRSPVADWYSTKSATSSMKDINSVGVRRFYGVGVDGGEEEYDVMSRRRTVMGRARVTSLSSQLSVNHLGMEDDELGTEEDWTRSVLMAADVDFGFGRKP